ncbi:unnamed protein product [Amoebophrya sp. A120]|nr:unnamed protein product [Amoebophrya sp. A120]|eukprot:GSA120T00022997001.1
MMWRPVREVFRGTWERFVDGLLHSASYPAARFLSPALEKQAATSAASRWQAWWSTKQAAASPTTASPTPTLPIASSVAVAAGSTVSAPAAPTPRLARLCGATTAPGCSTGSARAASGSACSTAPLLSARNDASCSATDDKQGRDHLPSDGSSARPSKKPRPPGTKPLRWSTSEEKARFRKRLEREGWWPPARLDLEVEPTQKNCAGESTTTARPARDCSFSTTTPGSALSVATTTQTYPAGSSSVVVSTSASSSSTSQPQERLPSYTRRTARLQPTTYLASAAFSASSATTGVTTVVGADEATSTSPSSEGAGIILTIGRLPPHRGCFEEQSAAQVEEPSRSVVGGSSLLAAGGVVEIDRLCVPWHEVQEFAPLFRNPHIPKIYYNYSWHRFQFEQRLGITDLHGFHADVMHMSRLSDGAPERAQMANTNLEDCTITAYHHLETVLQSIEFRGETFHDLYHQHWHEFGQVLAEIESRGVGLNVQRLQQLTAQAERERGAAEQKFRMWVKGQMTNKRETFEKKKQAELEQLQAEHLSGTGRGTTGSKIRKKAAATAFDEQNAHLLHIGSTKQLMQLLFAPWDNCTVKDDDYGSTLTTNRSPTGTRPNYYSSSSKSDDVLFLPEADSFSVEAEYFDEEAVASARADAEQNVLELYQVQSDLETYLKKWVEDEPNEEGEGGSCEGLEAAQEMSDDLDQEVDEDEIRMTRAEMSQKLKKLKLADLKLWVDLLRPWSEEVTQKSKLGTKGKLIAELLRIPELADLEQRRAEQICKADKTLQHITIPGLGLEPHSYTKKGWPSVSKDTLAAILKRHRLEVVAAREKDEGGVEQQALDGADARGTPTRREGLHDDVEHEVSRLDEALENRLQKDTDGRDDERRQSDVLYSADQQSKPEAAPNSPVQHAAAETTPPPPFDPSLLEYLDSTAMLQSFMYPLANYAIEYNKQKSNETLAASLPRIYMNLNLYTATGRLACRKPNLQNVPTASRTYNLRSCFAAAPGKTFVIIDYSQLELRLLAHLANCEAMLDGFKKGGDFHSRTALAMFPHIGKHDSTQAVSQQHAVVVGGDVTNGGNNAPETSNNTDGTRMLAEHQDDIAYVKDQFPVERKKAKTLNFAVVYGVTKYGLAKTLQLDGGAEEAEQIINTWYARFPEVLQWQQRTIQRAYEDGYVETLLGRRRWIPDLHSYYTAQQQQQQQMAAQVFVDRSAEHVANRPHLEPEELQLPGQHHDDREDHHHPSNKRSAPPRSNKQVLTHARRKHLERVATNTPVQGSAADVVTNAMIELHRSPVLKELKFVQILQIHDELILEGPVENAEAAEREIIRLAESTSGMMMKLRTPLVVDSRISDTWM